MSAPTRASRPRRAGAVVAVLAAVLAALVGLAPASPAAAAPPPLPAPNSHGLTVLSWTEVPGIPRLYDAYVRTNAIFEPIHVRIHLPAGYQANPAQPYPVLYLTHGADESGASWSDPAEGDAADILDASAFEGITVMPEAGRAGWYIDWLQPTDGGYQPLWETFHVGQLVPWVDDNFNTIESRSGRAIAGLSMGGYGALIYAARYPNLFSEVASFSGPPNIRDVPIQQVAIANSLTILWGAAISTTGDGYLADDIQEVFGDYEDDLARWQQHNPYDLAASYAGYDGDIALYVGGGLSEIPLQVTTNAFHTRLNNLGLDHRYCTGQQEWTGEHDWAAWRGDLADFLATTYGTTPATCPNGFGAPTP